jgi:hypothetical protein
MALTAYSRFRFLWGAVDWQGGSNNPYGSAQTGSLGTSAVASGGIGVRRCVVTFDRTNHEAGLDPDVTHFDFLNMTAGAPDDTWTTSDFTTLEGYLTTMLTSMSNFWASGIRVTAFTWYRVGIGIGTPNPNVRQLILTTPIAGGSAGNAMPPQIATTVTYRTAVRKAWGRSYIPFSSTPNITTIGRMATTAVDSIAGAANTMAVAAAGSDFYLGVYSKRLSAFLVAEKIEVDNVLDIVRRRRFKTQSYRKILP